MTDASWFSPREVYWGAIILEQGKKPHVTDGRLSGAWNSGIAERKAIKRSRSTVFRRGTSHRENINASKVTVFNDCQDAVYRSHIGKPKKRKNTSYYWLSRDHIFMQAAYDVARWQEDRLRGVAEFKDMPVPLFFMPK
ncbi:hypothetical protein [Kiloniella litopenaei]|uniref:hypothetical protein n=1 Tax=Kiloniella litopenaei TaxID=1549748 RepID=UPI003BA9AAAD